METMPAAAAAVYPDSVESSPRSRGDDIWDEPCFPSSAAAATASSTKIRLMCSYGGRIVPRPTDKSLCYLGGETRIVIVERHSSLSDLHSRLSRILLGGSPFVLKYQLPSEDLDSLISVTTDEDLDNMIDEYDRLVSSAGNARTTRLRLFLFPPKSDSTNSAPSSIGSLLDDSKSESWFVDALNGAMEVGGISRGLSEDSASVNCLLGLEDDSSAPSKTVSHDQIAIPRPDSAGRLASVPDSPIVVETASSFGSASSVPTLANLPPIRIRADDRPPDPRLEDHFAQMNISSAVPPQPQQRIEDGSVKESGYVIQQPPAAPPPSIPLPMNLASPPTISPTENSNKVFSSGDEKSYNGGAIKIPRPLSQSQVQTKTNSTDAHVSDSFPMQPVYYQDRVPSTDAKTQVSDQSYMIAQPPAPVPAMSVQPEQFYHQQPQKQQFIQANPQFIHHPSAGPMLTMPPYYHVASHPIPQSQPQIPMYYMPVQPNAAYNVSDTKSAVQAAAPRNVPRQADMPPLIHVGSANQAPHSAFPPMSYQIMHHHPTQGVANYGYEIADPNRSTQMLYAQTAASPPQMMPPYHQTVSSQAASTVPDMSS